MKTLTTLFTVCLATAAYSVSPMPQKISVYTGTWLIDFYPNGRASAQYGSNPGDSGYVDEGTIDFKALLNDVTQAEKKSTREPGDRFQIAIELEGQTTATGFVLADDSLIERTLAGLDEKWKPHPVGQRFFDLKAKYPIIQKKKTANQALEAIGDPGSPQPQR